MLFLTLSLKCDDCRKDSNKACRFPGADALRSELEHFVAKHAKRPGLHTLPEAAALLATPAAANSGTATLQTLQNWAVAPLLQACAPMLISWNVHQKPRILGPRNKPGESCWAL